jgi:hypothetical protein
MFQETKMLKCKTFISGRDMVVQTRDGRLSMLIKLKKRKLLEQEASDSKSTNHSTSDQDSQ